VPIFFPPSLPGSSWLGFRWLFQTEGPVNALSSMRISPILARQHRLGNAGADFVEHWKQLGFNMVVFWLDCKPFLPAFMRQLS